MVYVGKKVWEKFIEGITEDVPVPAQAIYYARRSGGIVAETMKQLITKIEETREDKSITNIDIYFPLSLVETETTQSLDPELFATWINRLLRILEDSKLFVQADT